MKKISEDAPVNNVGDGNIAGVGIPNAAKGANWGEPGIRPRIRKKYKLRNKQDAAAHEVDLAMFRRKTMVAEEMKEETPIKRGKFAGHDTFVLPRKKYNDFLGKSKQDRQWWKTYMGEDEGTLDEVRVFARKNPKAAIVFEDEDTGACFFARYGKKS